MPQPPIIERIARNLVDALRGINTEAGYHHTLAKVQRKALPDTLNDLECILVMDDPSEDASESVGRAGWSVTFGVIVGLSQPEQFADDPVETRALEVWADVFQALRADPRRGGLAMTTNVGAATLFENAVEVPVTVTFDTRGNDLTQQ